MFDWCEKDRTIANPRAQLHPTYKIFLYFLAGISNDTYARGMPSRSPLIPSTLDEAEEFFSKAQELICTARIVNTYSTPLHPHEESADDSDDSSSSKGHRSRHSEESISRPSTAATSISTYSVDNETTFLESTPESKPSPQSCLRPQNRPNPTLILDLNVPLGSSPQLQLESGTLPSRADLRQHPTNVTPISIYFLLIPICEMWT